MKTSKTHLKEIITTLVLGFLLISSTLNAQDENKNKQDNEEIEVTEEKEEQKVMPFQLTFLSPLGTNGMQSGQVINNASINMLAGISGGVRGAEFGGLANISKGDIIGFQAAGLANTSLGYVEGVQMAGLANFNKGYVHGAQIAGLANLTTQEFEGLQLAGLVNVNAGDVSGSQIAGLVNTTAGSFGGLQLAGIANVATKEMNGTQIGLVNYSRNLKGFQLGLINIADSVSKGAGLGLITYYRNGYHAFEVESNETFYANLTFKSGVRKFYMLYTVGFKTHNNRTYWAPGIGMGSNFSLSEKVNLNTDLMVSQVNEGEWWTDEMNLLNKFKLNAAYKFSDKASIYGGPTFNVAVSSIKDDEGNIVGGSFSPWSFYDQTNSSTRVEMYIGFNVGMRF